jgi:hypothetical protein
MAVYRIHRMKDAPRQQFRWAPHANGTSQVKQRDYEPGGEIEAASAYALWDSLRGSETALQLGDLLELPNGELRIFKYVGFEEAHWAVDPRMAETADAAPALS